MKSKTPSKQVSSSKSSVKTYRSPIAAAMYEMAEGLHKAGSMSKQTLRDFDELCLTPVKPMKPADIRALRKKEEASQAVLARHMNVTVSVVSQWERGEKKPSGASLKLLTLIEKNGLESIA